MPERDEENYQYLLAQDMDKHDRLLKALGKSPVVDEGNINNTSSKGWLRQEQILTDNQADILYLASNGYTCKKIAEELGVSFHTVRKVFKRIYRRLGIPTAHRTKNVEALAVAKAHRLGLIWRTF